MESRDHARLGPSAAHRWIHCPGSVRLVESLEITGADTGSVYAAEGTAAHSVAEIVASYHHGRITEAMLEAALSAWRGSNDGAEWLGDRTIKEAELEMVEHALIYSDVITNELDRQPGWSEMHLELKVHPGVPSVWGTGDCVIVGPREVAAIDYKYGTGVRVAAPDNEQLMLYALGALEADILGTAETIRIIIVQPRLDHVSVWELPVAQLKAWREEVAIPAAELAMTGDAPFGPSVGACRFCPARGQCRAQVEWIAQQDFKAPDLMDEDDYAYALSILPAVRQWAQEVEERALQLVYSDGGKIPGYKVVLSGGKRAITDEEAAVEKLVDAGYDRAKVVKPPETRIQTLAVLDKVVRVGKTKVLAAVLGELMGQTEGRPSLVPESDGRPEHVKLDQAVSDFADDPLDD